MARAQQAAMPVIGFLSAQSAHDDYKNVTVPFLQGLKETGYIEGQNVAVECRYADNQFDRRPALVTDLVRRRVAVIVYHTPTLCRCDGVTRREIVGRCTTRMVR
jgi:putative tryptophan/tyrosine transport system substrate-binding protein